MKKLTSFQSYGKLVDGQIIFDNEHYWLGMLKGFQDEKSVRVIVEKVRGGVSQKQYGYLYGHLYVEMSTHIGYTVDELDEVMKAKFLQTKKKWRGGDLVVIRDKHNLTNEEMGEFIQRVYDECLDLGLQVEPPDKEWRVKKDFPEAA